MTRSPIVYGIVFLLQASNPRMAEAVDTNPLEALGYHVTEGAASGYIEDRACAVCHYDLFESFQEVGMAKSFYRPGSQPYIEDFSASRFYHASSKRHYELIRETDRLLFRRYLLDREDSPIHEFECEVDWIVGSGNHSRTYLYQTELGELFQLPIQWYSQTNEWGMAPGFDRENHEGVGRLIRRECMFCHNAYPEIPEGDDGHWTPHIFPSEMPQGIGCQRCHGPGANHVQAAVSRDIDEEAIRASIVNPSKLEPDLRDDVCNQCHLQPTVALFGVRRFDRGDYSFRPGEPLSDYLVQMDVDQEGKNRGKRFEINHHAYRLDQSACRTDDNQELSCLTCHDPHHKVAREDRAAHYNPVCLECHSPHDPESMKEASEEIDLQDCIVCHMPKRRPQDVVHTVMTDHRIGVYPDREGLVELIIEEEPILTGIDFYNARYSLQGPLGEIYKALAVLRAGGNPDAVAHIERSLRTLRLRSPTSYLDWIGALIRRSQYPEAGRQLDKVLSLEPNEPMALEWKAIVEQGSGNTEEALRLIDRAIEENPNRPEAWYNRGLFLFQEARYEEAIASLSEAIHLRPHLVLAQHYMGKTLASLGRTDEAVLHFKNALSVNPAYGRASLDLGSALIELDQRDEAIRFLDLAIQQSKDPELTADLATVYRELTRQD